jgi:superfamily II DNA or RNA helicase
VMLLATIDSMIRFPLEALPRYALRALEEKLRFVNPEFLSRKKYGRAPWRVPRTLELFEVSDGRIAIPRGAVDLLREICSSRGIPLRFENRLVRFEPTAYDFKLELRGYQQEAVSALVDRVQGYAVAPCGAGKSVIGAVVIARSGQPSIILVHTHDLLEQWRRVIRETLGLEAGVIAEGQAAPGQITVAMVQTLAGMSAEELGELGWRFGCVVVDECHHTPAVTFRTVLGAFPGQWRVGLSATPTRTDCLDGMLRYCIGPELYRVTHERLVEEGHLIIPQVRFVKTGCSPAVQDHHELVSALVEDEGRNQLILDLAAREARAGHTVLVLSQRVAQCGLVAEVLKSTGIEAAALIGKTPKVERESILARFRSGELSVLVSSQLADEGLDVPRVDRIILATPSRAEGRTIQRIGRAMRPSPGKGVPILYDLVDSHGIAWSQKYARQSAYKRVIGAECAMV